MANGNNIQYQITLQDLFSPAIEGAEKSANHFESTLGELTSVLKDVAIAMGIAFGVEKMIEFGKETFELTKEFQGFDNVIKYVSTSAKDADENISFLKQTIKDLHLPMKETYEGFSEMAAGLQGTGVEGKSLRDLFYGISSAMSVLHLNSENAKTSILAFKEIGEIGLNQRLYNMLARSMPGIGDVIKKTFHKSFDELNEEGMSGADFLKKIGPGLALQMKEGLAQAAHSLQATENDMDNYITSLKLQIGNDFTPVFMSIMEHISSFVEILKSGYEWVKANKEEIFHYGEILLDFSIGIGAAVLAMKAYELWAGLSAAATAFWTGFTIAQGFATSGLTVAQYALNLAMEANPIGIVVVAIGALIASVIYAWNHFAVFRAVLTGVWEFLKAFVMFIKDVIVAEFMALGAIIEGALTFDLDKMKNGLAAAGKVIYDGGKNLAGSFKKGYDEGLSDFAKAHIAAPKVAEHQLDYSGRGGAHMPHSSADESGGKSKTKGSPAGQKILNITISIGKLIDHFEIKTTNIQGSMSKVKDMVQQALISAVNDSQIVPER